MESTLPEFIYHPNPLETESIITSSVRCICCGQQRGYIYSGPVHAIDELGEQLCPWCIHDGSAHEKFEASFTDEIAIGDCGNWDTVSEKIVEEVAYRTPGFSGWQQQRWWTHCDDAAAFLGAVGFAELQPYGEDGINVIADDSGLDGDKLNEFIKLFHKDNGPTAYLFRCRHCGKLGGYQDCL